MICEGDAFGDPTGHPSGRGSRSLVVRRLDRPPIPTVPFRLPGALALFEGRPPTAPTPLRLHRLSKSGGAPPHYKTLARWLPAICPAW